MGVKFGVVSIALFLLLLSVVSAQVDDVSFFFNGNEIEYFGLRMDLPVQMVVTGSTSAQDSFELRGSFPDLNVNVRRPVNLNNIPFSCTQSGSSFECGAQVHLFLDNSPVSAEFTLIEDGQEETVSRNLDFTFDTTAPRFVGVQSVYNYNSYPVIRSGSANNITLLFEDSMATFFLRNVYFNVDSTNRYRVSSCEGMSCSALFFTTCSPGETSVALAFPSTDDAGNAFTGTQSYPVICDQEPPRVVTPPTVSFDDEFYTVPKQGDAVTVWTVVSDDATEVFAFANFSTLIDNNELIEGQCERVDFPQVYNCSWNVQNINPGEHRIVFDIRDSADRLARDQDGNPQVIKDLEVDEVVDLDDDTPLFFLPTSVSMQATQGYNRVVLDTALQSGIDYPIFGSYQLRRSGIGSQELTAVFSSLNMASCRISAPGESETIPVSRVFRDISVQQPRLNYDQENMLQFVLAAGLDVNIVPNQFSVLCELDVVVREGTRVYARPTKVVIRSDFVFRNTALGKQHPGERYVELIQQKENRINSTFPRLLRGANNVLVTLNQVCSVDSALATSQAVSTGVTATVDTIASAVPIISPVLAPISTTTRSASNMLNQNNDRASGMSGFSNPPQIISEGAQETVQNTVSDVTNKLRDFIRNACKWSRCSKEQTFENQGVWMLGGSSERWGVEWLEGLSSSSSSQTGLSGIGDDFMSDMFSDLTVPSPQQSIVASAATMCWPGVVYHLNKYQQMSCQQLLCMKQQARTGGDIDICAKQFASQMCQEVVGEVFETFPTTRAAANFIENGRTMIRNAVPRAIRYFSDNFLCSSYKISDKRLKASAVADATPSFGSALLTFACGVPRAVGTIMDLQTSLNTGRGTFVMPNTQDVCRLALCNDMSDPDCYRSSSYLDGIFGSSVGSDVAQTLAEGRQVADIINHRFGDSEADLSRDLENALNAKHLKVEQLPDLLRENRAFNNALEAIPIHAEFLKSQERINLFYDNSEFSSIGDLSDLLTDEDIGPGNPLALSPSDIMRRDELNNLLSETNARLDSLGFRFDLEGNVFVNDESEPIKADLFSTTIFKEHDSSTFGELSGQDSEKLVETFRNVERIHNQIKATLEQREGELNEQLGINEVRLEKCTGCDEKALTEEKERLEKELKNVEKQLEASSLGPAALDEYNNRVAKAREVHQSIQFWSASVARFIVQQGWMNWALSTNWGADGGQFDEFMTSLDQQWLNVENYKQSMCDPLWDIRQGDTGDMGAVFQCQGSNCRPVLSQAAEQLRYNDTHYLLSISYVLGPVSPPPTADTTFSTLEEFYYNIRLRSTDGTRTYNWFDTSIPEFARGVRLPFNQEIVYSHSKIVQRQYDEMCIRFDRPYPPQERGRDTEFCRPIIDSTQGDTLYDTGTPVSPDTAAAQQGSNPSSIPLSGDL